MKALFSSPRVRSKLSRKAVLIFVLAACAVSAMIAWGCSSGSHPPPSPPVATSDAGPREGVVEGAKRAPATTPYRATLSFHHAALYLPTWFSPTRGGYDLVVHFHGMGKLQEENLDRSQLDAAVVSLNLGVSTDLYGNAFRDPASFQRLLDEAQEEIANSGRAQGAKLRRIALSAWSAGFVSISKIMSDPDSAAKIDAVMVGDGFFTSLTNVKKRTVNSDSLTRFVTLAESAKKDEKLFVITHSSIPTQDYASTEETAAKLIELTQTTKVPNTTVGPRNMHEIYAVDQGSFHIKGFEGFTAGDHIKHITAAGETMYPYLKARWDASSPNVPTAAAAR